MIIDALILQTKLFLSSDMEITINEVKTSELEENKLNLKEYTSMIGIGGTLNAMIIISYEKNILDHLMTLFLEGEEVIEEEKEEVLESVSGEVINTIIGLSIPNFPKRGKGVTITPPITINDASNIKKYKNSKIVSAEVITEVGTVIISVVGSEDIVK